MTTTSARLRVVMDTYGHTAAMKSGSLSMDNLELEFVPVDPVTDAFRPMIERGEFDVCEMAIVTFLQAKTFDKPLALLPVAMLNRFHHNSIVVNTDSGIVKPADLAGRRVGVRAYSQTSGVWVRGILQEEYGLDPDDVEWVTFEGAHVAEYQDPSNVTRYDPADRSLGAMLVSGDLDAAVVGRAVPRAPHVQPLFSNALELELAWFERVGYLPVNHLLVVRREILENQAWAIEELMSLFARAKRSFLTGLDPVHASDPDDRTKALLLARGYDPLPLSVSDLRAPLEAVIRFAVQQRLIPRPFAVDELFETRLPLDASPPQLR